MTIDASVEWFPFPEPIGWFYLVNVPGGVTTITVDFGNQESVGPSAGKTLGFCDINFAVYANAGGVVLTDPILYSGSSPNPSITVSPTSQALLIGVSTPNLNDPTGTGPPGYIYIIDNMSTDGIGTWQSPSVVMAGAYSLTFSNPGYNTSCNGPLGNPNPCPLILMGAAIQSGSPPPPPSSPIITQQWIPATGNAVSSLATTRSSGGMVTGACMMVYWQGSPATYTISDSHNTYNQLYDSNNWVGMAWTAGAAGNPNSVTVTSSSGTLYSVQGREVSAPCYLDGTPALTLNSSGTSPSASTTTVNTNDIVLAVAVSNLGTTSIDPGAGYTALQSQNSSGAFGAYTNSSGAFRHSIEDEYKTLTAAGTQTPNFTVSAANATVGAIAFSGSPVPQTIASVNLSGTSFPPGAGSGTVIGTVTVTMSPTSPLFTGSGDRKSVV